MTLIDDLRANGQHRLQPIRGYAADALEAKDREIAKKDRIIQCRDNNLADAYARIEQLEGAVRYLFQLIDDIDTASDIAKHDDKLYRALVETIQAKRWSTGITTDGYALNLETLNSGRDMK